MERQFGKRESAAPFNIGVLKRSLNRSIFGKNIVFRDTIGSTNTFLKNLAQRGASEGTVVVADDQSAGMGRLGRRWYSRARENLLFSVLLRPEISADKLFVLTMIFALAGIDAVGDVSGGNAVIKWPNDIYIARKKIGGILSEVSVFKGVVQHVVLGMGLNVNWEPSTDQRVLYPTSSLRVESGKRICREDLLGNLLKRFERYYEQAASDRKKTEEFHRRWNEKSAVLGKTVVIETGRERIEGEAAGIDEDGALTVILPGGRKRRFLCGDVSVRFELSENESQT